MSSGFMTLSPVMFPPGCARLATNPAPTGSALDAMTMGMVLVACLAARAAAVVPATMMSTCICTRSAVARSGHRSGCCSSQRTSRAIVWPST